MKTQASAIAMLVATAAILAVVTFLYLGAKDAYSGMKEVNQAVISLQDNLMRAQGSIKGSLEELDKLKKTGEEAVRASVNSLQSAQQTLSNTQTIYDQRLRELQTAQQTLETTKGTYEERLRQLQSPPAPRNP